MGRADKGHLMSGFRARHPLGNEQGHGLRDATDVSGRMAVAIDLDNPKALPIMRVVGIGDLDLIPADYGFMTYSMNATIRIAPPQSGQTSGSAAKIFLMKCAQVARAAFV